MENNEPFKDLIDPMIEEIYKHRKIFVREYDDSLVLMDLRWQNVLEGCLFEQLYKLSHDATAEQIGEYVIEFFNSYDTGKFDVDVKPE